MASFIKHQNVPRLLFCTLKQDGNHGTILRVQSPDGLGEGSSLFTAAGSVMDLSKRYVTLKPFVFNCGRKTYQMLKANWAILSFLLDPLGEFRFGKLLIVRILRGQVSHAHGLTHEWR